jgi:hypothetical protein
MGKKYKPKKEYLEVYPKSKQRLTKKWIRETIGTKISPKAVDKIYNYLKEDVKDFNEEIGYVPDKAFEDYEDALLMIKAFSKNEGRKTVKERDFKSWSNIVESTMNPRWRPLSHYESWHKAVGIKKLKK